MYADTDVDPYEHHVEYERLLSLLTGRGSEAYAVGLHASQTSVAGGSKLAHLHTVSELAKRYANRFYTEADFFEQAYRTKVSLFGGLLHEAMEQGGNFEDIVEVGDENVARLVASLTPDVRMPRPKRRRMYLNQVGNADATAQIVKLADLQHECRQLLELPVRLLKDKLRQRAIDWQTESLDVLNSLGKLRDSFELQSALISAKADLHELGHKLDSKKKR